MYEFSKFNTLNHIKFTDFFTVQKTECSQPLPSNSHLMSEKKKSLT